MSQTASRLQAAARVEGEVRLVPYVMAGYPDARRSIELGRAFAAAGAAAVEVGIPFSDPLADGPTVQRAGQAALEGGMTVAGALEVASGIAREGVPVVVMTYVNPLFAYDARRFAADAAAAGVAGVTIPDLPAEEAEPIAGWLRSAGLDTIFFAAPTSPPERLELAGRISSGFIYCVTLTGVTGARSELGPGVAEFLGRVRKHTSLPLAAGFGISRPEHIRALRGSADAAIVASALLERVHRGEDPLPLMKELMAACR